MLLINLVVDALIEKLYCSTCGSLTLFEDIGVLDIKMKDDNSDALAMITVAICNGCADKMQLYLNKGVAENHR